MRELRGVKEHKHYRVVFRERFLALCMYEDVYPTKNSSEFGSKDRMVGFPIQGLVNLPRRMSMAILHSFSEPNEVNFERLLKIAGDEEVSRAIGNACEVLPDEWMEYIKKVDQWEK